MHLDSAIENAKGDFEKVVFELFAELTSDDFSNYLFSNSEPVSDTTGLDAHRKEQCHLALISFKLACRFAWNFHRDKFVLAFGQPNQCRCRPRLGHRERVLGATCKGWGRYAVE